MKNRYEVVIPWHGKNAGDVIEIDGEIKKAFAANVRKLKPVETAISDDGDNSANSEKVDKVEVEEQKTAKSWKK